MADEQDLSPELEQAVDDFRRKQGLSSRAEAIRRPVQLGLSVDAAGATGTETTKLPSGEPDETSGLP